MGKILVVIFLVIFVADFIWQTTGIRNAEKPNYFSAFWVALFIAVMGLGFIMLFIPTPNRSSGPSDREIWENANTIEYRR